MTDCRRRQAIAFRLAAFILLAAQLTGCAAMTDRTNNARGIADAAGLRPLVVKVGAFDLQSYVRFTENSTRLTVYIEGDGLAWVSRHRKSMDPTPITPVALQLAALDPAPSVAYLARPCQFIGARDNPDCTDDVWTRARFSDAVLSAMSEALDRLKTEAGASSLDLIGYSGGGGIAILLAARRSDVTSIITIAGNLDQPMLMRLTGVSQLDGSRNPADAAVTISHIPQIHFIGTDDAIVPPAIAASYLRRAGDTRCISVMSVPDTGHSDGWAKHWNELRHIAPKCS